MSSHPFMLIARRCLRVVLFSGLLGFLAAGPQLAAAQQSFTLTNTSSLLPVFAGETTSANLVVTGSNGFSGSIDLTCAVTPAAGAGFVTPTCLPSPASVTPGAQPSLTVYTTAGTNGTPVGTYTITVTGTNANSTPSSVTLPLSLTVIDVPQDYTLSVSKPVSPGTVSPGNGATASILITPVSGYSGVITLSCASITPAVVGAPVCSFANAEGKDEISITNGSPAPPITLTLSTFGTNDNPVARRSAGRVFYAFWLGIPGLALVGVGASASGRKKGRRTLLGFLLLLAVGSSILILPSCNSTTATSTSNLVTPKNTYTITLTGVDNNGNSPSNVTTSPASVSLIVN